MALPTWTSARKRRIRLPGVGGVLDLDQHAAPVRHDGVEHQAFELLGVDRAGPAATRRAVRPAAQRLQADQPTVAAGTGQQPVEEKLGPTRAVDAGHAGRRYVSTAGGALAHVRKPPSRDTGFREFTLVADHISSPRTADSIVDAGSSPL
ncbi:hypothetical protein [Solwaraspora sp. WMMD792]|uniref:hypothetical protein n=1 Tax=Solwaraspora sp. WMMD792 TaxID=3016099 RepID=UPI002417B7AC|nr:hypothetical protein [Solwaraspora sp. WMMD792]MDG4770583.1 hypothetical protein [Solwaraspora sp. WMMD792]